MRSTFHSVAGLVLGLFLLLTSGPAALGQDTPPAGGDQPLPQGAEDSEVGGIEFDGAVHAFDPVDQSAPAWAWIDRQLGDAQFLLFGEQHYVEGIARATQTGFERYVSDGFGTLVLEASPFLGRRIRADGPDAVLEPYPYELAFSVDGMVELIEAAHALAPDPGASVYGIDQPVTAIHSFTHLSETLSNDHARRIARGLSLKAALQAGEYLRVDHEADFAALRAVAGEDLDADAARLLGELELSMEIYTAFRAARRGDGPRGLSDSIRETFMGEQLDQLLVENGADTRAIILMGGAHIMRGIGPNGVETLGQHAAEIATGNGRTSVHIGVRRSVADQAFPPAELFVASPAILIDTRSVLEASDPRAIAALEPDTVRDLNGFDALVYLREAPRESSSIMSAREAGFRDTMIGNLVVGGGAAMIGLIALIGFGVQGVRLMLAKPGSGRAAAQWGALSLLSVSMTSVLIVQILGLLNPGNPAAMANAGAMNGGILAGGALAAAGLAIASILHRSFSLPVRVLYGVSALGVIALALWMRHWNIGGML